MSTPTEIQNGDLKFAQGLDHVGVVTNADTDESADAWNTDLHVRVVSLRRERNLFLRRPPPRVPPVTGGPF